MRHRKSGTKLGRTSSHRRAMYNNLMLSLFEHESIETTITKAKELKRLADRMITLGKKGTLAARRQAARRIRQPEILAKLFDELAPRYEGRPGGYSRIMRVGFRRGDAAPMGIISLLSEDEKVSAVSAAPATPDGDQAVTTKEQF